MKTCGDVRRGDRFHQARVVADLVRAKRLTHVGVDVDAHAGGPYLPSSDVVFLSSSFAGFGGRGRLMLRLTPFQNGSIFRSISWRPCRRYFRLALSHCRPAVVTIVIHSPRAVSSGASVLPSHTVTFGWRAMKSCACGLARAPLIDL